MLMVKTIIKNMFSRYATRLHPYQQRVLPDGFRGRFKFATEKCIMCCACAQKCPTKCLRIEPETGLWSRENMACIYCEVCADSCPTGCITMTNVYGRPLTAPRFLEFQCKPRVKKIKASATEKEKKEAVETAILERQQEQEKSPQHTRKTVVEK